MGKRLLRSTRSNMLRGGRRFLVAVAVLAAAVAGGGPMDAVVEGKGPLLGSKRPYQALSDSGLTLPRGLCKATKQCGGLPGSSLRGLVVVSRHGARLPTSSKRAAILRLAGLVRDTGMPVNRHAREWSAAVLASDLAEVLIPRWTRRRPPARHHSPTTF